MGAAPSSDSALLLRLAHFSPDVASSFSSCCYVTLALAVLCFVVSEAVQNYSQVDKLWSILPAVYGWMIFASSTFASSSAGQAASMRVRPRLLLMVLAITFWSLRLTWNFNRRGGFDLRGLKNLLLGEEDHRWGYIRDRNFWGLNSNRAVWLLFNWLFICCYQLALIFAFSGLPMLVTWQESVDAADRGQLRWIDAVLFALSIFCVLLEGAVDNDHQMFQKVKYASLSKADARGKNATAYALAQEGVVASAVAAGNQLEVPDGQSSEVRFDERSLLREDVELFGFRTGALFSLSRHPNWVAEQCFWVAIALFAWPTQSRGAALARWRPVIAGAGAFLLILLFQGSVAITEEISRGKYPLYARYARNVPVYPIGGPWRLAAFAVAAARAVGAAAAAAAVSSSGGAGPPRGGGAVARHAWRQTDAGVVTARRAGPVVAATGVDAVFD